MSDLISRQALMKEFSDFVRASNNSDFAQTPTWNDAVSLVGSMPSVQPQPEIIRCKDCKWHGGKYHCRNTDTWGFDDEDFCSLAERRTDE